MKAVSPIIEHLILSAAALVFFVFVIFMFTSIQDQLLADDLNNRLTNLAGQVALRITQAYETGGLIDEIDPSVPVVRLYMDVPSTISGYSYVVRYSDDSIIASSHGQTQEAGLLGMSRDFAIEGKIIGSNQRRPAITYYKSQNRMVLENVG